MEKFARRIYTKEIVTRFASGVHERAEHEFHREHELFYLFEGEATIFSDKGKINITDGTLAVIPKGCYHCIARADESKPFLRCTCHFDKLTGYDELINKKLTRVVFASSLEIALAFNGIRNVFERKRNEEDTEGLMRSFVGLTIASLVPSEDNRQDGSLTLDRTVMEAVKYIDGHIGGDLSIETIAAHLHISSSYLSYLFKKNMLTPIHKYILNKRLILANKKILSSTPSVTAAMECGFSDYSNFYVQYKKRFGISPSQSKN